MAVYIGDKNITEVLAGNALDSAKQYADQGDANTLQQAKEYTDSEVSQFEADYKQADATVLSEAKQYADQNMIPKSQKGQPGGLAELDETGRVPSSQLPSYVDDVIDVDTYSNLPNPGESGKIYITTDNNKQYRWSGTGYAEISSSLALGETSSTAYRGDRGKVAYDHSQIKSGNPHGTTFASLPDKPTSLPANGGNADTVDNLHASDLVAIAGKQTITGHKIFKEPLTYSYTHDDDNSITNLNVYTGGYKGNIFIGSKNSVSGNTLIRVTPNGSFIYKYNNVEHQVFHSGNLNPVTIDSDQIITGWKRFTPKTKNGVYNTSGIIGDKDVYGTPLSWNVDSAGSFWHIQQYSNTIALIGLQGGKPFQIRSTSDEISVTADKFNGAASNILDRSNNSSKSIWTGTQAEYDAISTKDSNTIYFIV